MISVNNPPKFWLLFVALVSVIILMGIGRMSTGEGLPIVTLIVGYGAGNGIAAKRGEAVEPALGLKGDSTP